MRRRVTAGSIVLALIVAVVSAQRPEEKRKALLENDRVRVRELFIEPGIDYAPHTHQYPHVGVIVKGGKLRFTEQGKGKPLNSRTGMPAGATQV